MSTANFLNFKLHFSIKIEFKAISKPVLKIKIGKDQSHSFNAMMERKFPQQPPKKHLTIYAQ